MAQTKTLHEFRPSWAAWFWWMVLSFGILIPYVWYRRRGVRFTVTEERVIKHTGRVGSATEEIQISEVSRIKTSQSLGEKLLGGGTITLDTGPDKMTLSAVPNHEKVVETIRQRQSELQ
jgi:uncharacterized membrane protein YdbT with pleckstrin-like domain